MSGVELEAMKAYLKITNDDEAATLQGFIDAAEALIANRIGPLVPTSVTTRVAGGSSSLSLNTAAPLVAVTSLAGSDGSTAVVSDLYLDTTTGTLMSIGGSRFNAANYVVTYVAGWSTLPADIVMAIKEQVRHLWQTQRGANSARGGSPLDTNIPGQSSTMPNRVLELLAPYVVPRVA